MTDEELQQANAALLTKRAALQAAQRPSEPSAVADLMPSVKLYQLPSAVCSRCHAKDTSPGDLLPTKSSGMVCRSCHTELVNAKRAAQIQERLDGLNWEMEDSAGVPPKYCELSWKLPEWAAPYVTKDRGILMTGSSGTGKTTTMCLLMREHRRHELQHALENPTTPRWVFPNGTSEDSGPVERDVHVTTWQFVGFPKFVMELQDAWRRQDEEQTAYQRLKALAKIDRLILDDLGAEKLTDYVRQATYFLINEREQWGRPTYLTTNFSLAKLDEQFDSRISSRIAGICDVKTLKGKDRRLTP